MKLTDIMFNMSYVAANCGSDLVKGGDVFKDEELKAETDGTVKLTATAVPFVGSEIYAYVRKDGEASDKRKKMAIVDNKISGLDAGATYCVRYLYTDGAADRLVVSSQFIPKTLYAVLTVALYAGDDKNAESATKVGKVVIKIPRFQLSGAMEISMTATGASQTALDGSAMAYGGKGCDGRGIYAEIIQVLDDAHWYDDASGLIIEDNYIEMKASDFKTGSAPVVYAWYPTAAPKQISNAILAAQESALKSDERSKLVFGIVADGTGLAIDSSTGIITGNPTAGTATIKVVAQDASNKAIPGMEASATIVLS